MNSVLLAVLVAALFGAGCAGSRGTGRDAATALPPEEADFSRALAHFAHGIILEAESAEGVGEVFNDAARLDPDTPMLSDLAAAGLLREGRVDEAIATLERRCRHAPTPEAHGTLAQVAEAAGRHELALEHFERAERLAPDDETWRQARIRVLFALGRDRRALKHMQALCLPRRAPPDPSLPYAWGVRFIRREKEPERGLEVLRLAMRCATNAAQRAQVYDAMAGGELGLGNTNAARTALLRAAKQDCSDVSRAGRLARFDRAVWGGEATNRWREALARDPHDSFALLALAQESVARRDWGRARERLEKVRALCRARGVQRLHPAFHSLWAHCLEMGGATDEADQALRRALREHPDNAMLCNHQAYFWAVHNRELEQAEKRVRKALEQEPRNGAYLDTLGWIYYRQGRHAEALAQLTVALRLEGDDPEILDHVGDVLLALGRLDEAIAYWRRSLRLDPSASEVAEKLRRHEQR